jgi:hypothetical protein
MVLMVFIIVMTTTGIITIALGEIIVTDRGILGHIITSPTIMDGRIIVLIIPFIPIIIIITTIIPTTGITDRATIKTLKTK